MEEVRKNDVLIIVGETGSGKTTRKFFSTLLKFVEVGLVHTYQLERG